ncbi:hypothetical protein BDR03DRAFT_976478, partial [Suillus americanus]
VLSSGVCRARVGRQIGPKHIQSQAFFFFVLPSLLHFTFVLFQFSSPLLNPVIIFLNPVFFGVNAL